MTRIVLAALTALIALGVPAEGATYFVSKSGNDRNSCANAQSDKQPLQKLTIAAGLSCLKAAGDTLTIHAGTYTESIVESQFPVTGTSRAAITVQAAEGETVTLRPKGGRGNVIAIGNSSRHHLTFRNLHLDGINAGGGGGGAVFHCGGGDNLTLDSLEIYNGDGNGLLCGGSFHDLRNLRVHHNGLSAAYVNSNGAYMVTNNTRITGGEFYDNECYGIRFWESDNAKSAENNIADGMKVYHNGYHTAWAGASQCGSDGGGVTLADRNNTIKNSLIYNNYHGIYIHDYKGTRDAQIYNNTITGNSVYGLYIPAAAEKTAYKGNTVRNNGTQNISDKGRGSVFDSNLSRYPSGRGPGGAPNQSSLQVLAVGYGELLRVVSHFVASR